MTTIMTSAGTIVTESIEWALQFVTAISGNPLLLAFVLLSFVGLGIGIIRRLIRL